MNGCPQAVGKVGIALGIGTAVAPISAAVELMTRPGVCMRVKPRGCSQWIIMGSAS